jgi:hypothetical protein
MAEPAPYEGVTGYPVTAPAAQKVVFSDEEGEVFTAPPLPEPLAPEPEASGPGALPASGQEAAPPAPTAVAPAVLAPPVLAPDGAGTPLAPDPVGVSADDVGRLTAWLVRERYIKTVAELIGPSWRAMTAEELTADLAQRFTEQELTEKFLAKSAERAAVKARFRGYNIVTALVVGLLWAQENIAEGEGGTAAAKVGGSVIAAWAVNRLLYARDIEPAAKMAPGL